MMHLITKKKITMYQLPSIHPACIGSFQNVNILSDQKQKKQKKMTVMWCVVGKQLVFYALVIFFGPRLFMRLLVTFDLSGRQV